MFLCVSIHAQQHDNIWLFGYESYTNTECFGGSLLNFNANLVDTSYQYRDMNIDITNASICDSSGNLLFYTNGIYIANSVHAPMENGEGLNPGEFADDHQLYGYILDQGAIVLPKPGSSTLYYLFHASREYSTNQLSGHSSKFYYTLIDMSLNGGLGAVVEKNQVIIDDILSLGKITATKHANGVDWWILLRKLDSNKYYRILVTSDTIINKGIQEVGEPFKSGIGQAVFSPDGSKYAIYSAYHISEGNHLNIFDFEYSILVDSAYPFGAAISYIGETMPPISLQTVPVVSDETVPLISL